MSVSQSFLDQIALSWDEYELIVERLGREPNELELGMFGALWSEHCGYKNSGPLLRILPSEGPFVLTRRGAENAGAVDIGDGLCVVMKIESHNHPSAIEPYQGAATGIGGIVRDVFAMGARPIALLDSLRFGPLNEQRNRYLFEGVVAGIAGYGNCLGIPTVGGEVYFERAYSQNPLINVMCVGVVLKEQLASARATGAGNPLMLVGADTGRDGLHGASGLASRTDPHARYDELRPAVQIGDPFLEKLLMEACLDLAHNHAEWIVGIQDLGAAGLTASSLESAARGGSGLEIDVAKVPRREEGMTPYEVMIAESQERMLIIVRKGHEDDVKALFDRWELRSTIIGVVTDDGLARIREGEREVARLPVGMLTEAPQYSRQGVPPAELAELQAFELDSLPDETEPGSALLRLLSRPTVAGKQWVYRQYDHHVLTNTADGPGGDAAVMRIRGTKKGIALCTDGNGRYCYLDPYAGGAIAVAEAARNVVCVGAQPVAITDCLNFGDPNRPEVYYQMEQVIGGMAAACAKLGVPVISGNVSLYNETGGEAVYPSPVIGMLGLLEDVSRRCPMAFAEEGQEVFLLGGGLEGDASALAGSEYLKEAHGLVAGRPSIDPDLEVRVQRAALEAIGEGLATACHDCSEGGLAVALAEMCIGGLGLDASGIKTGGRVDAALFGERQSRIVMAVAPEAGERLAEVAAAHDVPIAHIGRVAGQRLVLGSYVDLPVAELAVAYGGGVERALGT
ncbi:MAG: phosphoribosylformylglycinamidine synthase subunit PurL [Dehalococcoidia bacterium]|nr:MAG: phosphoribosylformylglycinamidine synthase subunit PurL [Dehalococcoidia bacterium]